MRILSKSGAYRHTVRNEVTRTGQDEYGTMRSFPVKRELTLEFKQNGLTQHDYAFAMQHWMRGTPSDPTDPYSLDAWGAHPDTRDGVANGQVYRGWNPLLQISMFDTASLAGDDRDDADAYFVEHPVGQDWVVVEELKLSPPFPNYDKLHAAKIAGYAKDLGLIHESLVYEAAMENRESVMLALRKALGVAAEEAAEDAAMQVHIP